MSIDFWRALQVLVAHKAVVRTGTRYRLAASWREYQREREGEGRDV